MGAGELGPRLVVATHNPGKAREIAMLLAPYGLDVKAAGDLGLPEPEETEATFGGNAALKARAAADGAGLPALADDSGLCVAALNGAPGVHSARWAGDPRDFARAMEKIEEALRAKGAATPEDRAAYFICMLCLAFPGGGEEFYEGRVEGTLVWPPRGSRGFGYDPMFLPLGASETYGEIDPEEKHRTSHRARAFAKLVEARLAEG